MAPTTTGAMASALPTKSILSAQLRDNGNLNPPAQPTSLNAAGFPTPPTSVSPNLAAYATHPTPPPMRTLQEHDMEVDSTEDHELDNHRSTPLSKGALSGLDASAAITPQMLAKHHLPGIMLGNGPRPIRDVMGELMRMVPGFSRIPPAKARRLVVSALEWRQGGGLDGSVIFCKTGWGRWEGRVISLPSAKDSAIGSFPEGHLTPPRSEHSSFAASFANDSAVHMPAPKAAAGYYDAHSGGSWASTSNRIEEEADIDMDALENEADKMSMDGDLAYGRNAGSSSSELDEETEDEDWAAAGPDALRKASMPAPGAPKRNYQALSVPYHPSRYPGSHFSRRPSGKSDFSHSYYGRSPNPHFASAPQVGMSAPAPGFRDPSMQTPEEKAAIEALMSMGSM